MLFSVQGYFFFFFLYGYLARVYGISCNCSESISVPISGGSLHACLGEGGLKKKTIITTMHTSDDMLQNYMTVRLKTDVMTMKEFNEGVKRVFAKIDIITILTRYDAYSAVFT